MPLVMPALRRPLDSVLAALRHGRRPIFIGGHERTGTSWVGRTLGLARRALYYHEPCHGRFWPDCDELLGYLQLEPGERHPYFERALDGVFAGLLRPGREWPLRLKLPARLLPGFRVVVKEVMTTMFVEWVAARYRAEVIVPIRHPCAVVLSQIERGKEMEGPLAAILSQKRLMTRHLALQRRLLESVQGPVEVAAAVWAARSRVACEQVARHPEWHVLPYEQLAADPVIGFRALYARYGLGWSERIERIVIDTTSRHEDGAYSTVRIARERSDRWRHALTQREIDAIRRVVAPFTLPWYRVDDHFDRAVG